MINIVDGDILVYRAASSCEPTKAKPYLEPCETAIYRLHDTVQTIIKGTNCDFFEFYIQGTDNFRKELYPAYKANRTKPPPTWLQDCREILVTQYGARIINGHETDDELGIRQTFHDGNSRICSIDKDLLMIPGSHYNWVKNEHKLVSPLDGLKTFYKQIISGDGTDNIPSYDGKIRGSVPKFIEKLQAPIDSMTDEVEMYEYVLDVYFKSWDEDLEMSCLDTVKRNANLIYILREEGKFWKPPNYSSVHPETGQA